MKCYGKTEIWKLNEIDIHENVMFEFNFIGDKHDLNKNKDDILGEGKLRTLKQ